MCLRSSLWMVVLRRMLLTLDTTITSRTLAAVNHTNPDCNVISNDNRGNSNDRWNSLSRRISTNLIKSQLSLNSFRSISIHCIKSNVFYSKTRKSLRIMLYSKRSRLKVYRRNYHHSVMSLVGIGSMRMKCHMRSIISTVNSSLISCPKIMVKSLSTIYSHTKICLRKGKILWSISKIKKNSRLNKNKKSSEISRRRPLWPINYWREYKMKRIFNSTNPPWSLSSKIFNPNMVS